MEERKQSGIVRMKGGGMEGEERKKERTYRKDEAMKGRRGEKQRTARETGGGKEEEKEGFADEAFGV